METSNVIRAEYTEEAIIHVVSNGEEGEQVLKYHDIRGGLSWPTPTSPAYYCIVGEEYQDFHRFEGMKRRGELRLLVEHESDDLSLGKLFSKLTDHVAQLHCRSIYTDLEEPFSGLVESFWNYAYENGVRIGNLTQAPYADNFLLGISWIQDWVKKGLLNIPEGSAAYSQLKGITKPDLAESPEIRFPGINGLRFVVGAFHKNRQRFSHFVPSRRKNFQGRRPRIR